MDVYLLLERLLGSKGQRGRSHLAMNRKSDREHKVASTEGEEAELNTKDSKVTLHNLTSPPQEPLVQRQGPAHGDPVFLLESSEWYNRIMANGQQGDQPEARLLSDENRFREIVERATEVIFTLTPDGKISYANPAARKLTGYSPEELLGREFTAFIVPDWRSRVQLFYQEQLRELKADTTLDFPIITRYGLIKWVEQTMTLIHHQGRPDGMRALVHDITERVKAEEARKKLKSMQADFVSLVTHELRTPLTSILGYLQLLLTEKGLSPTQTQYLEIINANSRRLRQLVDDILQAGQLESGHFEYQPVELELSEILEEVALIFQVHALGKGLQLTSKLLPGLYVCGDRNRLIQVFSNLVANAIKYTERGSVSISMVPEADRVSVEITDTGFGISEEDQKDIFQRFYRSPSREVQKVRGIGLGLYITKTIVDQHKGEIRVKSELGHGTTIRVSLPLISPLLDPFSLNK
ncbi:PAS domain-containing sensor histidine kinase [Candidatus Acetothermia bacterium]|nr:PAS domain-containing sensor histidine kinase [Candidatus Acetothermia bacterium]